MWKLGGAGILLQAVLADGITVSTFGGASGTELSWVTVNDPVMGGHSESTFTTDSNKHLGIWEGSVRNVLPYSFPGFCSLRSTGTLPDLSSTSGLTLNLKEAISGGLSNFRVNVMSVNSRTDGGSYSADFTATSSMESHSVLWSDFVCKYRGDVNTTCEALNPLAGELHQLTSVGLGIGEQVGSFSIQLESMVTHGRMVSTFGDASTTELSWVTVNDPVMGGHSESSFHEDSFNHLGLWSGTVHNVLPYALPGFCTLRSTGTMPDLSATSGLTVNLREAISGGLHNFRVNIMSANINGYYEADFTATSSMESHSVLWSDFVCKYRGDVNATCLASNPLVGELNQLSSVGLSVAEQVGSFSIELKSMFAHDSAGAIQAMLV